MEVGKRITFFRERKGITVNKLAYLAGISQSFVREIELGNKKPTIETLSALCDALGISLKEFFDDGSPSPTSADGLEEAIFMLTPEQRKRLADFIKSMT
jgi:transcriptional regulator with XRE-family HTH domain